MKRRLFTLASILSLLLCAATLALWVRTYHNSDELVWRYGYGDSGGGVHFKRLSLVVVHGGIAVQERYFVEGGHFLDGWDPDWSAPPGWTFHLERSSSDEPYPYFLPSTGVPGTTVADWRFAGFQIGWEKQGDKSGFAESFRWLTLPIGFVSLTAVVLPTVWSHRLLRKRRLRRVGVCPTCGYDLRASTARCPECGTAIP